MKYSRDRWLGYDQRFCQWAAANPGAIWARTDPTLWRTRRGQSKLVQILPQPVSPLGWLLHHLSKILPKEASSGKSLFASYHHHGVSGTVSPVCYEWNSNPTRCDPTLDVNTSTYALLYQQCKSGWKGAQSSALVTPTAQANEYWANIMTKQLWERLPTILVASAVNRVLPHLQAHHLTIVTTSAATLLLLLKPCTVVFGAQCVQMLMSTVHVFKA